MVGTVGTVGTVRLVLHAVGTLRLVRWVRGLRSSLKKNALGCARAHAALLAQRAREAQDL